MFRQASLALSIRSERPGLHEFTDDVRAFVNQSGIGECIFLFERRTATPQREIALHQIGE